MKFCSHDLLKTGHTVCNMFVTGKSSLIFAGQIMHQNVAIFIDVYAIFHEPFGVAKNRFAILVPGVDQAWWVRRHSRHEALSLQSLRQKLLNNKGRRGPWAQCDQIWRNFATLAKFYKSLAIFWRFISYLANLFHYWIRFRCCKKPNIEK